MYVNFLSHAKFHHLQDGGGVAGVAFLLQPQASLQANGKAEKNCFPWCYFDSGLKSPLKAIGISTGHTATNIPFTHNQSCIVSHVVRQAVREQHAVGNLAPSVYLRSAKDSSSTYSRAHALDT